MATSNFNLASLNAQLLVATDGSSGSYVGASAVSCNMVSNSFSGTLSFQATVDGNNWFPCAAYPLLAAGTPGGPVSTTTTAIQCVIPVYGYQAVRVICTSYTSGNMQVYLDSNGAAPVGQLYTIGEGQKATYSAAINAQAPAATPTDAFTILGSATKTIRVCRIGVRLRATAATQYRTSLIKYSTAYTGGTAAAATIVPHDSNDAAATAVVNTWAGGLPTPGSAVGKIRDESLNVGVLGTPTFEQGAGGWYDFGVRPSRAIVLRGVAQYLAVNFAGVAVPSGGVADYYVEWTEE